MCGILGVWWAGSHGGSVSDPTWPAAWDRMLEAGRNRGPDRTQIVGGPEATTRLAFHRLAIHDLSEEADQPFRQNFNDGAATLMCNGEIYNYPDLCRTFPAAAAQLRSRSDCEILLPLWDSPVVGRRSIARLVDHLDGVFAIVLDDHKRQEISLARDRLGVRPLFYVHHPLVFAVASTPGPLEHLCSFLLTARAAAVHVAGAGGALGLRIREVHPRTTVVYHVPTGALTVTPLRPLIDPSLSPTPSSSPADPSAQALVLLRAAVRRRLASDRPVCCLLSGGIDSSAVACLLVEALRPLGRQLTTFSIGQPGSEDLRYARLVADALGTDHREVIMDAQEALDLLPTIVADTATYDVTTVRASTPMWMLCRHIARTTDFRVVFSGEGADEMAAGYLYFHSAPAGPEGDRAVEAECLRLVSSLHEYDVLRADRCTAAHGLELREPFLDRTLLDWTLRLPGSVRRPRTGTEKIWLRGAMALLRDQNTGGLPVSVIWRRKAAFSDAVSAAGTAGRSWFQQIQEHLAAAGHGPACADTEAKVYRGLFLDRFAHYEPHRPLWLPRWQQQSTGNEPSATVLGAYVSASHE